MFFLEQKQKFNCTIFVSIQILEIAMTQALSSLVVPILLGGRFSFLLFGDRATEGAAGRRGGPEFLRGRNSQQDWAAVKLKVVYVFFGGLSLVLKR